MKKIKKNNHLRAINTMQIIGLQAYEVSGEGKEAKEFKLYETFYKVATRWRKNSYKGVAEKCRIVGITEGQDELERIALEYVNPIGLVYTEKFMPDQLLLALKPKITLCDPYITTIGGATTGISNQDVLLTMTSVASTNTAKLDFTSFYTLPSDYQPIGGMFPTITPN